MTGPTRTHRFSIKRIDEAYSVAQLLSGYFPKPERFVTAIYELLLNAIEHGNLGIGFETKTNLIRSGKWLEEILRRQSLPEHAGKQVDIELRQEFETCQIMITDQGDGFPWKEFMVQKNEDRLPNGRGLLIASHAPFDSITFNAVGNTVTCTAHYSH